MLFYILDENNNPKRVEETEWAHWFENHPTVIKTEKIGPCRVQTVFKSFLMGEVILPDPPIWETKIKGGPLHDETTYCGGTRDEALKMHEKMIIRVKNLLAQQQQQN